MKLFISKRLSDENSQYNIWNPQNESKLLQNNLNIPYNSNKESAGHSDQNNKDKSDRSINVADSEIFKKYL